LRTICTPPVLLLVTLSLSISDQHHLSNLKNHLILRQHTNSAAQTSKEPLAHLSSTSNHPFAALLGRTPTVVPQNSTQLGFPAPQRLPEAVHLIEEVCLQCFTGSQNRSDVGAAVVRTFFVFVSALFPSLTPHCQELALSGGTDPPLAHFKHHSELTFFRPFEFSIIFTNNAHRDGAGKL
jgi:hypothetical protein